MAGKSASLLTKTQRTRIRDDFGDLAEEKKRRDQQRIRERVRSGLLDFQLLVDYPDRQFALMFDDVPDDELRAALADATIVIERLREHYEIDRAELVDEVRTHVGTCTDATDEARTLEQIDLRTAAEIQRQTKDDLAEQFEPGRWDRRADGLMKLGVSVLILVVLVTGIDSATADNLLQSPLKFPFSGFMFLLFVSAGGWLLINTAQSLKYNVLPFLVRLLKNPKTAVTEMITKLFKNPGKTVRESWDEL